MARARPLFRRVVIVGLGLIGSSLARVIRRDGLAGELVACDASAAVREKVLELGLADRALADPVKAVRGADLVMLCTPVLSFGALAAAIGPKLARGAILSDVGSVKGAVVEALAPQALVTAVQACPAAARIGAETYTASCIGSNRCVDRSCEGKAHLPRCVQIDLFMVNSPDPGIGPRMWWVSSGNVETP